MPRKPRFVIPGVPLHIVQRGNSREPVFFADPDYLAYLRWLKEAAIKYRCAVHAYVLMTNHVHILATPEDEIGITRMMQYVGRHYVPYINHTYGTSGSIWEGRYKASLIHAESYLLTCMRYIELNPVRAAMVKAPAHYRWSSYHANALGRADELVTTQPVYSALGRSEETRREAYKALVKAQIDADALTDIRCAWQTGTPLGNDYFRAKVEAKLGCTVGHSKRGRPRKPTEQEDDDVL